MIVTQSPSFPFNPDVAGWQEMVAAIDAPEVMNLDADDVHAASAQPEVKKTTLSEAQEGMMYRIAYELKNNKEAAEYLLPRNQGTLKALISKGLVVVTKMVHDWRYYDFTEAGREWAIADGLLPNETPTPVSAETKSAEAKQRIIQTARASKETHRYDYENVIIEQADEIIKLKASLAEAVKVLGEIAALRLEKKPVALSRNEPKYVLGLDVAYDDVANTASEALERLAAMR